MADNSEKIAYIFFSWQSDMPTIRNEIRNALKKAILDINRTGTLRYKVEYDEATRNTLGAPNIVATIEEKIAECAIFVADVSFVGEIETKKVINQNVAYETGYAIAKHNSCREILVLKQSTGAIEELPFDIRSRRILSYINKADLSAQLQTSIMPYLENIELVNGYKQHDYKSSLIQSKILELFSTIEGDKRIGITKTMGGIYIQVLSRCDESIIKWLEERDDSQEVLAEIEDLVENGLLSSESTKNGKSYFLTKNGYNTLDK